MSPEDAANYVRRFAVAALKMLEAPDVGALIAANLEIAELEGEKIPNLQQEVRFLSSENGTLKKQVESNLVEIDALKREILELKGKIADAVTGGPTGTFDLFVESGPQGMISIRIEPGIPMVPEMKKLLSCDEMLDFLGSVSRKVEEIQREFGG